MNLFSELEIKKYMVLFSLIKHRLAVEVIDISDAFLNMKCKVVNRRSPLFFIGTIQYIVNRYIVKVGEFNKYLGWNV